MIFSLTDAQAAALTVIRDGGQLDSDVRVWAGLVKRGFVAGDFAAPKLTPLGNVTASLAEMLAIPVPIPEHAGG